MVDGCVHHIGPNHNVVFVAFGERERDWRISLQDQDLEKNPAKNTVKKPLPWFPFARRIATIGK